MGGEQIYQGRLVSLRRDEVLLPSGRRTTREIVEHPDCVAVVAIDRENNVVLVRQFRTAAGQVLLEIPAGSIEPGEDTEECARRELEEETGYVAGEIKRIGGFYSSPGYSTEYLHLFLATDLKSGTARPDEDEIIQVVLLPLGRIRHFIVMGKVCDAKSIAGLLTVVEGYRHKGEGK